MRASFVSGLAFLSNWRLYIIVLSDMQAHEHNEDTDGSEHEYEHDDADEALLQLGILEMWVERVQGVVDELCGPDVASS